MPEALRTFSEPSTFLRERDVASGLSRHHIRPVQLGRHFGTVSRTLCEKRPDLDLFACWLLFHTCVRKGTAAASKRMRICTSRERWRRPSRCKKNLRSLPAASTHDPCIHHDWILQRYHGDCTRHILAAVLSAQARASHMCHSSVASLPGRPAANCDASSRSGDLSSCCCRRCRTAAACHHGVGPTAPHTSHCRDIRCELCDFPQRYQKITLSLSLRVCVPQLGHGG